VTTGKALRRRPLQSHRQAVFPHYQRGDRKKLKPSRRRQLMQLVVEREISHQLLSGTCTYQDALAEGLVTEPRYRTSARSWRQRKNRTKIGSIRRTTEESEKAKNSMQPSDYSWLPDQGSNLGPAD
jgi:hypothetical protein